MIKQTSYERKNVTQYILNSVTHVNLIMKIKSRSLQIYTSMHYNSYKYVIIILTVNNKITNEDK
jgi:hypothetical protein